MLMANMQDQILAAKAWGSPMSDSDIYMMFPQARN